MRPSEAENYRHPHTSEGLNPIVEEEEGGRIVTGRLLGGDEEYGIVNGIPRFCPRENYSSSFGYQWQFWSETQLDSRGRWGTVSESRLFGESEWPRNLEGERILEAGCGMGRFTEILATTGAKICSFDYSAAVEANFHNNGHHENVCFAQADIYAPPYEPESFDKVLCIGVLQHCPSPKRAFLSLTRFVKPGGEIFVDNYLLSWKSLFLGKYYLRPVTRLLSAKTLHRFVKFHVGWVFPFTGWLQRHIGRPGRSLSCVLAMPDYRGVFDVDEETARELSRLDAFDALAPAYDRPKTFGAVRKWFDEAGLVDVVLKPGSNGIAARGRKPA